MKGMATTVIVALLTAGSLVCVFTGAAGKDDEQDFRRALEVFKTADSHSGVVALRQFVTTHPGSGYAVDAEAIALNTESFRTPQPVQWEGFARKHTGERIHPLTVQVLGESFADQLNLNLDHECRVLWEYFGYFLQRSDVHNLGQEVYGKCAFLFASELADRIALNEKTSRYVVSALKVMRKFYEHQGNTEKTAEIEKRLHQVGDGGGATGCYRPR